ncbi:MAG TPA: isocitrate lyase/phosphoenolpyruvate mutase family protein [Beijerinckiaceae bacterium]|jgi:2-methylisocitrate lyase-like PEP mutase family enzyme
MTDSITQADRFRALHVAGRPLVIFNVWDAGSAKVVAVAGAKALATGSWSVAAAHGVSDGEALSLDLVVSNLERIIAATDLPVSIDIESGYGPEPGVVARTVERVARAGAIGCNLEDSNPGDGSLRPLDEAASRVAAARAAFDRAASSRGFVNARTDVFFQRPPETHDVAMADAALERARAYADAGADGLFVPGIVDERLIARVVAGSPLPVNVMVMGGTPPVSRLAALGVARISHGPGPYRLAMAALEEAARAALRAA